MTSNPNNIRDIAEYVVLKLNAMLLKEYLLDLDTEKLHDVCRKIVNADGHFRVRFQEGRLGTMLDGDVFDEETMDRLLDIISEEIEVFFDEVVELSKEAMSGSDINHEVMDGRSFSEFLK